MVTHSNSVEVFANILSKSHIEATSVHGLSTVQDFLKHIT